MAIELKTFARKDGYIGELQVIETTQGRVHNAEYRQDVVLPRDVLARMAVILSTDPELLEEGRRMITEDIARRLEPEGEG